MFYSRTKKKWRLYVKHVRGESGPEEEAEVRASIAVGEEEARLLEEIQDTWELLEPAKENVDVDQAWRNWLDRKRREVQVTHLSRARKPAPRNRRRTAAAIPYFFRVAAVVTGALLLSLPLFHLVNQPEPVKEETEVFTTGRGQRTSVQLPDGTQVTLNADSRITVSRSFGTKDLNVWLQGEAYFEVPSGREHPLTLYTEDVVVQVRGTAFNVRAYANENTEVVVASGLVLVAPPAAVLDGILLQERNAAVVIDGRAQIKQRNVDLERYVAWVTGGLVFKGAYFEDVQRELQRRYNLEIELAGSPRGIIPLDASFRGEPLSEILTIIAGALDLEYARTGQKVIFSPKQTIHS